jgi:hypothetical protein
MIKTVDGVVCLPFVDPCWAKTRTGQTVCVISHNTTQKYSKRRPLKRHVQAHLDVRPPIPKMHSPEKCTAYIESRSKRVRL